MKDRLSSFLMIVCIMVCVSVYAEGLESQQSVTKGTGTSEDPYLVPKTASAVSIDGILDEETWARALVLELRYEVQPGENITPPVKSYVLLAYDSKNLYAAFRCYDPDPSAIRASFRDHDNLGGDDWAGLVLDTFNDERRSFDFLVTPLGGQFDQIETINGQDPGWDALWESAGRINDWGYALEMCIPFSSIRFQRSDGPQIWGFDAVRSYPRDHQYRIGLFPRDRSNNLYLSQALKIQGFEGVNPGRNIELNPTLIGFRNETRENFPDGKIKKQSQDAKSGLNASWGITPNLTLNAAINPDFSQVEADALQMDINQPFALYYPERRPFFTEGADYFSSLKQIIYSRTIRDPSWGVKITGREGSHTLGAYMMRDELTNFIFPGPQGSESASLSRNNTSSVIRYRQDFTSHYTAGLLFTDREGQDYFNRVYGFDLDFRVNHTNQFQLLVLGSSTAYPDEVANDNDQKTGTFNGHLISFEYDHNSRTWGWWADYEEACPDFRADLGFFPRVGYRNAEGGINYAWNAPPDAWWARFQTGCEAHYVGTLDSDLLNREGSVWFSYNGAMQSGLYTRLSRAVQTYNAQEFDLTQISLSSGFWPFGFMSMGGGLVLGDAIDYVNARPGRICRGAAEMDLNLGKHLHLSLNYSYEHMDVKPGRLYTANIGLISTVYQFNPRTLFRSILQYVNYDYHPENYAMNVDSEYKRLFTQLLFSYKFNPRTVLFLGYTDGYAGDQDIRLTQTNRSFFMKLGYAWTL